MKPKLKIFIDENKGFTVKRRCFLFWWTPFIKQNTHNSIEEAEKWAKEAFKINKKEIRL